MRARAPFRVRNNQFAAGAVAFILVWIGCLHGCEKKEPNGRQASIAVFQLYVSGVMVAADQSDRVASGRDCFGAAGLRATLIKRSKGPEIVDALVGGSADFGTLAITPVVLQILQGSDLVIFATIQTTDHDIKVIGHRTSGVKDGASLNAKRVGYVGGTFGEIFLDRYLEKHELTRSDIRLTSAGPAQLRDLFLARSLDAIIIWEPTVQDILADSTTQREEIFLDIDTTLYTGRMNLVATPQVLQQKREEAVRLVTSLICGEELIAEHSEKVRATLENWLDRSPGTLKNVFDKDTFHVELDVPALLDNLRTEAAWANRSIFGNKAKIPEDFSFYVDSSIMESVASDRVRR